MNTNINSKNNNHNIYSKNNNKNNHKIISKNNNKNNNNKSKKIIKFIRKTKKNKRLKGGLLGAINSGYKNDKPDQQNVSYTKKITKNSWFSSKIYNIEYITPTFLLLKDPNSTRIPYFNVNLDRNGTITKEVSSIQIEVPNSTQRKFIEYLVCIDGDWYAMMRLYGLGLNEGVFATWTNTVFFKINNNWFDLKDNSIHVKLNTDVVEMPLSSLNIFQRVVNLHEITNGNQIILKLNTGTYTPITSGDIYYILRQFRNEQLINAGVKEEAAKGIFKYFIFGQ
jgi:hypothetical protein